jgi:branched-chain amino acid transport system substrate-binding protein
MKFRLIVLAIAVLVAFGCAGNFVKEDVIKIGVLSVNQGEMALYGEGIDNGFILAYEELGLILGRNVKLYWGYDDCLAKEAVNSVYAFLGVYDVDVVVGNTCSNDASAVAKLVSDSGKIFLAGTPSVPGLTLEGENVFRIAPSDALQGKAMAEFVEKMNFSNVGVLFGNHAYGLGVKDSFLETYGGEILIVESLEIDATDAKTELNKIQNLGVETLILPIYYDAGYIILKQAKELGMDLIVIASETMMEKKMFELQINGMYFTSFSPHKGLVVDEFNGKYLRRFGKELGFMSEFGHDAYMVLAQAIEIAGTTETSSLRAALYEVSYSGASGLNEFGLDREMKSKEFEVFVAKDGEFVAVDYVS